MTFYVQRTCTVIGENGTPADSESASRLLEAFRGEDAYVLLGAPGLGKTTAFRHEAEGENGGGTCVTARDFLTFQDRPEGHEGQLFIDGLDEVRAGSEDRRTPLDRIRSKLDRLGRPRFRLSCREADWLGDNDRSHLKEVSPDGEIRVLRLDPLTDEDVSKILGSHPGVDDADEFVLSARERGLEALLNNPQSLEMLVDAVAGGNGTWPKSRTDAFELAVRTLLREHNTDHRAARPEDVGISRLMSAAGQLCAIQLLSGSAGYDVKGGLPDRDYPPLENILGTDLKTLRHVLSTKLFEFVSEGRASPNHRHTAEFLAGRFLAGLIGEGLPVRRVLALMTGQDGGVVSELRGLSAWLAAHSKLSRLEIIERDPLGTVLYGDVRGFTVDEKRHVFTCLDREARRNPWFLNAVSSDPRLGDLVTPDMTERICEILSNPTRDHAQQSVVDLVIEALEHGAVLRGVGDLLMQVMRDDNRWPRVRGHAVKAYLRQRKDHVDDLKALLADVNAGWVSDTEDDLLARLLAALYPAALSPIDIVRYLRNPKKPNACSRYASFWTLHVRKNSTAEQLADILDEFVAKYEELRVRLRVDRWTWPEMRRVPVVLLSRFLEISTVEIELKRLFDWLGVAAWVGESKHDWNIFGQEAEGIRSWLNDRPEVQKSLITMGLERCIGLPECASPTKFFLCTQMEKRRLFGAEPGPDFGVWCLDQALDATDPRIAKYFVHEVATCIHFRRHDEGLSREIVAERIGSDAALLGEFNERLDVLSSTGGRERDVHERTNAKEQRRQREWCDRIKPHEAALRENKAPPVLLYQLARAYLGGYGDIQAPAPRDRLRRLLGDDETLIEAVLEGFRGSITRSDLPSDTEVIEHGRQNRIHHLVLPFMAGLQEISRANASGGVSLDAKQMRLALTIHYNVPLWIPHLGPNAPLADEPPAWYRSLLASSPEAVSQVLIRSTRSKLRNGAVSLSELYQLANDDEHARVASLASLPLLEAFPPRCTAAQLPGLRHLLTAAHRHGEKAQFLDLIKRKLDLTSMSVAQRVYWLAAGLRASPDLYREKLQSYVSANERRVRILAQFVTGEGFPSSVGDFQDAPVLQTLIRLLGASYGPYDPLLKDPKEGGVVTSAQHASMFVQRCIERLASLPSNDAVAAFEDLSANEALVQWRSHLKDASYRQRRILRESRFQHPTIAQVMDTLDRMRPANVADLAALATDVLDDIATTIRGGNTDDWKQYWNVDSYNRPLGPKPEDACRDHLLSDFQQKVGNMSVDAQREGSYADEKRSDIRVSYGGADGFSVPVEIKKSDSRDLWSAIKGQLIAKYTRDPDADGYGIYLVFWFDEPYVTPGMDGRPKNAEDLETRLRGSLGSGEARRISVIVVDVAEPIRAD